VKEPTAGVAAGCGKPGWDNEAEESGKAWEPHPQRQMRRFHWERKNKARGGAEAGKFED
jgi:hypothetical protein